MAPTLKVFIAAFVLVPVLDFFWLGKIAKQFYLTNLDGLARVTDGTLIPVYWAAVAVYFVIALGLSVFVSDRILAAEFWWQAAMYGALFGFVVYGVYDFTNHATLKSWPLPLLFADIAWGAFVCSASTTAAYVWIQQNH